MDERSSLNGNDTSFYKPYMVNDEYILWTGKPGKKHLLTGSDLFIIPFSIFWCGFAISWEATAVTTGAPLPLMLFGLPFVLVGLYLVFGRFIHASLLRKNTEYAITNKKIIRKRFKKTDMLHIKNMLPMFVNIHKDGYGTIIFGQDSYYNRGLSINTINSGGSYNAFCLENIPDVAKVQQIITDLSEGYIT